MSAPCCDGIWRDNPLLGRLLGLCPLLAVCDRVVVGAAVGVILAVVMVCTQLLSSATRQWVPASVRLPSQALFAALVVTLIGLLLQTLLIALHTRLGIYLPVMAGCCLVLVRSEEFAGRQPLTAALADATRIGAGVIVVATAVAATRELLAFGSLFRDASLLWPDMQWPGLQLLPRGVTLPVAAMPAGALMVYAALLALHNVTTGRRSP